MMVERTPLSLVPGSALHHPWLPWVYHMCSMQIAFGIVLRGYCADPPQVPMDCADVWYVAETPQALMLDP